MIQRAAQITTTAVRLMLTDPRAFVRVLTRKVRCSLALRRLRSALRASGAPVIYSKCGDFLLPFHDDGDLQELYYHSHGAEWYAAERAVLAPHLRPGYCMLDVGANIGFITGIASRLVGPQGQVHSFEPSPVVYAKLQGVIRENAWTNVTAHNVGCGDTPGEMMLASPSGSSGNATLTQQEVTVGPRQKVQIIRLDDWFAGKLDRLDFIKIDTEGFEDHVLAGAGALFDAYHPTVYIELSSEYRQSSERAIQWLRDRGYTFEREPDLTQSHNGDNFIAVHSSKSKP